jgi:tripartite-type tricarboxylate transporter receptor subunit TctC
VPGYSFYTWFGLWTPKGTPQPIIDRLHSAIQKAQADPGVKAKIAAAAGETLDMPLADIKPFLRAEIAKWGEVVKKAGIQVQ